MTDESLWNDTASIPRFPALDANLTADVVIVGAGIMGMTAAWLLTQAGRNVVVLERRRCGYGDTGHTSAHLTWVTDLRLADMARTFGLDHARAVCDAGAAAIARIDAHVSELDIDCDFEWMQGYLHLPTSAGSPTAGDAEAAALERDAELARSFGFGARFLDRVPGVDRPGIEFDDQARIHPRKYLAGLARAIEAGGGRIFEHSAVDEVADRPVRVSVGPHKVSCARVIVATHTPIVGKASMAGAAFLQTKLALYSSYVVAGRVERGRVRDALFWDTADPYHYVRLQPQRDADVVIIGGEDHKTGQVADTDACFARLERAAREFAPAIALTHRWSGQVVETNDGLPYIGEVADGQFAATGFSGNGLTFGTVSAMMAADWVEGRRNPWAELFDVGRTKIRGGLWDYLKENTDYPYYLVRDRLVGPDAQSLRSVRRGEGKLVDVHGKRTAVYRSEKGKLTLLSPVCTHLGCHVQWNQAEHSWDCPCHGSRFTPTGAVISGPAESPLKPVLDKPAGS
jgi:glycine/D-amino acid oxidase-like deaminating enzyme/nitrite reductase/ring-hydroxylating ferredoxin subunit